MVSGSGLRRKVSERSIEPAKGDARPGRCESPLNRLRQRLTNGCASRLKHPRNPGIHFFFFDELTAFYLIDSNLHLLLEPFVTGKQVVNGLLHEFVGSTSGLDSKLVEFGFVSLR